jgi:phosphoribosylanthranilate isomerase
MTVRCKICDVRDFHTAKLCAQLGVDYIGLHAIWQINPERLSNFQEIVRELPKAYPHIGIVLVTRQQNILAVVEMVKIIEPAYIQLHAPWSSKSILDLRSELHRREHNHVQLIGVVALSEEPIERVSELVSVVDLLLLDKSSYVKPSPQDYTIDISLFKKAMDLAGAVPILIAGGLTPENVKEYIEALHPFGVDVQKGVEYPNKPGMKDLNRIDSFLKTVKAQKILR